MTGYVKRLASRERPGSRVIDEFGFIAAEGSAKDLFFHSNSLVGITFDELRAGDGVSFETEESPKGLNAINVQRDGWSARTELGIITSDVVEIESIKAINDEVIHALSRNPSDLYRLQPAMFEELVAEIFMRDGYATEFIKSWNQADGGVDIIAVRRDVGGCNVRYAIQCKRYAATRRITADPIRALSGVLDRFQAHVGVLATTSYFTKPAKDEVEAHLWKIDLRDYEKIVAALKRLELLRQ